MDINLDEIYNKLKVSDFWEQPNNDTCREIIKFLNSYIEQDPKNARAYYLRSMAKFHLNYLVPPDYIMRRDSEYLKSPYNPDEAYEDYLHAVSLDLNIVEKNPDIRVITVIGFNKYYFRKPYPYGLERVLFEDTYEFFPIVITTLLIIVMLIQFSIVLSSVHNLLSFVILVFCLFVTINHFYFDKKRKQLRYKRYQEVSRKKYCEKIEDATYAEWHG